MRILAIVILGSLITACATPQRNYIAEQEQFSHPELGEITTVSVGEEMLSQGNIVYQDGIVVPAGTTISGYTLHGGFYPQTGQGEDSTYHGYIYGPSGTTEMGALTKNPLVDPPQSIEATLDGTRLCVVTVFNVHTCRTRDFQRQQIAVANLNSFQQTLIYSGRVGDRINISYREFSGNMARPAFSNDVEYDLGAASEIAYRGARLEIIDASNTSITYRVLSNFNSR